MEFEIPFRELGFYGVPARSTSFIMPTVNCLVELTEMPFTVLTLSGRFLCAANLACHVDEESKELLNFFPFCRGEPCQLGARWLQSAQLRYGVYLEGFE